MEDDTAQKLEGLLDGYDAARIRQRQEQQKTKSDEALFLEHIEDVGNTIILPTFREIGEYLKSRGHDYATRLTPRSIDSKGVETPARIDFDLYIGGDRALGAARRQLVRSFRLWLPQAQGTCGSGVAT